MEDIVMEQLDVERIEKQMEEMAALPVVDAPELQPEEATEFVQVDEPAEQV